MEIIAELLSELSMIILALGFFVLIVGIRVSCPYCGARFIYHKDLENCPECDGILDFEAEAPKEDTNESDEMELSDDYGICPVCETAFLLAEFKTCPYCEATGEAERELAITGDIGKSLDLSPPSNNQK